MNPNQFFAPKQEIDTQLLLEKLRTETAGAPAQLVALLVVGYSPGRNSYQFSAVWEGEWEGEQRLRTVTTLTFTERFIYELLGL